VSIGEFGKKRGFVRNTVHRLGLQMRRAENHYQGKIDYYEKLHRELLDQIKLLENENRELSENLERSSQEFAALRRKYYSLNDQLERGRRQNEKLAEMLAKAREQIEALKQEIEKLCAPPNVYGIFKTAHEEGLVDVDVDGRKVRVNLHPSIDPNTLIPGQQLILNEAYNAVGVGKFRKTGDVVQIRELLDGSRAIVQSRLDEERVIHLGPLSGQDLSVGDHILIEPRSGYACELLSKGKVEEVLLEEIPDVTYEDIGGLDAQIEAIKDGIELPYLYPAEFAEHCLRPPKGILLYGPPGCGKTLIAKAVANSLAKAIEERTGEKTTSYFFNIKGPELLNKYVGETERRIREIFRRANERADDRTPVVIFFDEMDSLLRLRGSGISSDVEITIVSQFLAEIDGLEPLANVIVVGASNRQDLIDPAVLRPGRLDFKIKVDRPDEEAAKDIFSKYLTPNLPLHGAELAEFGNDRERTTRHLIELAVKEMYAEIPENQFLEVTYARGHQEILYFKDFASGAMIANVVSRAKKIALKRHIAGGEKGISRNDLFEAIRGEFKENEELPNTANPDDWSRMSGRQGDKIVNVRVLQDVAAAGKKAIEDITAGQYL